MRKFKIIIVENDEDEQLFMKEGFDAADLFEIIAQAKNGDTLQIHCPMLFYPISTCQARTVMML